ncbi:reticulon-like protein B9 isoform X2 [Phalaenopsis equestris]|uniref:reticulon-like protein B9 isoform X2 n=1 Tax=Phalaenopsis equestris TaxID=78828 RepID=UPI0009E5C104|nr:reticulon-like protein B9 isoform X2 [Phalaenopsis equestris]
MPPRIFSVGYSYDERQLKTSNGKLFGRRRTIHQLFGGGKVADIVLWRNKHLSGPILIGVTVTWFLFEVVEYHFLTLLCQLLIAAMLLIFIWSNGAALLDRNPPNIPEIILSERTFREFANYFHARLSRFLVIFQNVAMGRDIRLFLLAISSLWVISVVGSFFSSLNLLYLVTSTWQVILVFRYFLPCMSAMKEKWIIWH